MRLFSGAESQPSVFLEDPLPLLVHPTTPPPNLSPHLFTILLPYVNSQVIWNSLCDSHAPRAEQKMKLLKQGDANMTCKRCGGLKVFELLATRAKMDKS